MFNGLKKSIHVNIEIEDSINNSESLAISNIRSKPDMIGRLDFLISQERKCKLHISTGVNRKNNVDFNMRLT